MFFVILPSLIFYFRSATGHTHDGLMDVEKELHLTEMKIVTILWLDVVKKVNPTPKRNNIQNIIRWNG